MPSVEIDDDDTIVEVLNIGAGDDGDAPASTTKEDRGDVVTVPGSDDGTSASTDDAAKAAAKPDSQSDATGADDESSTDGKPARHNDQRIPKARFDEVNEARKEAERRAQEAEDELKRVRAEAKPAPPPPPAAPAFDLAAKEREAIDALLEGDTDKATSIRMEINAHIAKTAEEAAEQRITRKSVEAELAKASEQAVADHPYLDTPAGAEALQLIIWKRFALQEQGHAPAEALRLAVAAIAPRFKPDDAAGGDNTPGRGSPSTDKPSDTRTAKALERGLRDSQAQAPAMTAGIGNRQTAGKVNVETMTDEQFNELPIAEKRRLRGD